MITGVVFQEVETGVRQLLRAVVMDVPTSAALSDFRAGHLNLIRVKVGLAKPHPAPASASEDLCEAV